MATDRFTDRLALIAAAAALVLFGPGRLAWSVTPNSPEVQELVKRGLGYLDKIDDSTEVRLGGKCVIAMAYLKTTPPQLGHPRVREALRACEEWSRSPSRELDVYSNGLAVIFLCELNPRSHSNLIRYYLGKLEERQKEHGGWGYDGRNTGDTSQTQYAALSYWEAHNNGISIKADSAEALAGWLTSTQDPSGAWGYQGRVAEGNKLVKQSAISCSMVSAAMGSSLIVADLYGMIEQGEAGASQQPTASRAGLRRAGESDRVERKRATNLSSASLNRKRLLGAIERGDGWMDKNYKQDIGRFNVYYLYALERYKSFHELLTRRSPAEPEWYNNGYAYLKGAQRADGSWSSGCGTGPDTGLAILFLVRSTKQILTKPPLLDLRIGQRGLPKIQGSVKLVGGQLVVEQTKAAISDLLNVLDGDAAERLDALADDPNALAVVGEVDADSALRLQQIVRSGSPSARLLAVRTLSQTGDLDHVPTLIFALTDPDTRVVLQARDGLRFMSRRFGGFGLPDRFDDKQRYTAIESWKNWFLSLRPDATVTLN